MKKNCRICNSEFTIPISKKDIIHTCGKQECKKEIFIGVNNANWKGGENKQCIICQKEFWVKPSHSKKRKCCSRKCSNKWKRESKMFAGENNPAWKNGITELTRGIRRSPQYYQWRKSIKERDKCCVICGSDKQLHVDHIKPFKEYPDLRFDIENGRVLCWDCHKKTPSYGYNRKLSHSNITATTA